jgi:peptidoglycan/LPS O-acetylase OafA/YrhL
MSDEDDDAADGGGPGAGGGDGGGRGVVRQASKASQPAADPMEDGAYTIRTGNPALALLKCWSLTDTVPAMLTVGGPDARELSAVNGVRTLSLMGIILGHTVTYMIPVGFANDSAVLPPSGAFSQWHFQLVPAAEFAMDSFLVLSGFLAALALMRHMARSPDGRLTVGTFLFACVHRAVRLLPSLGLVIAAYLFLVPQLSSGPFWGQLDQFTGNCSQWWWTNVLFVNNLVPFANNFASMCMGWTFYIALDMQLFALV